MFCKTLAFFVKIDNTEQLYNVQDPTSNTLFIFLDMMSSQKLQDLFYMVLMAGNFLNSVSRICNLLLVWL